MKNTLFIAFLLGAFMVSAQKKAPLKPVKLFAKSKNQTVSMEYTDDVLYFSHSDLIDVIKKNTSVPYAQALRYLIGTGNQEFVFKEGDTTKFKSNAEKNVYKVVLQVSPKLLEMGKAADMVKKKHIYNFQVITKPCPTDSTKKIIAEKKGRVIFGCE